MAMIYSVYRGEQFKDVGTCKELCARWGWKESNLRRMAMPSRHIRLGNRALKVYCVGEEKMIDS